jgi:hypothetical protein
MKAPGILKTILLLFLANYLESITAPAFIKIYVAWPVTFLVFSGLVYISSKNINPIYAFCLGNICRSNFKFLVWLKCNVILSIFLCDK